MRPVRLAVSELRRWRSGPTRCSPMLPRGESAGTARTRRPPLDLGAVRAELERLSSEVEALGRRLEALRDERLVLPGYLEPLRLLLPLVPELADLDDDAASTRLAWARSRSCSTPTTSRSSRRSARAGRGARRPRCTLVWTRVDDGGIGCLVVFPHAPPDARACPARPRAGPSRRASRRVQAPLASGGRGGDAAPVGGASRASSTPLEREREALCSRMPHDCVTCARAVAGRARAARRTRPLRGDAARVRRRVLGAPARRSLACDARSRARLGAAVLVEDLATSPRDPAGAAADAQLALGAAVRAARALPRSPARRLVRSDAR